jgi:O-6-methylguanine DNA methyltransferase
MTEVLYRSTLESPLGPVDLVSTSRGLAAIGFGEGRDWSESWVRRTFPGAQTLPGVGAHEEAARQIQEYFGGRRRVFDLTLDLRGSPFQKAVWANVERVPYGRTASYSEIALLVGRPKAFRAVGAANGANPIPIVIPCHRIVGASGSLTGYGGGLSCKRWLLIHEGVLKDEPAPPLGPVQLDLFARRSASVP